MNFMKIIVQAEYEGASHGDDMSYLFKLNIPGIIQPTIDSNEFALIKQMVSFVTSFAINGHPNGDNDSEWEPVDSSTTLKCFNITNDSMEMVEFPGVERLKVWNEICEDSNVPLY